MTTGAVALISAATAFLIANITKIIIELAKGNKDYRNFISSGGMPSAHTASVVALTTAIGIGDGFNSTSFALALVFSIIVAYDATHVRRAVGEHGKALHKVLSDRKIELPYNSIGHSHLEMFVGCLVGVATGLVISLIL